MKFKSQNNTIFFGIYIIFVFVYSDQLDATVQNCIETYTSDWVVVRRKYHHHSSSNRPLEDLQDLLKEPLPQQEFEIDDTPDNSPDYDNVSKYNLYHSKMWKSSGWIRLTKKFEVFLNKSKIIIPL